MKNKKFFLINALIILIGIFIRSYFIQIKNIFTDEVFYSEIALKESLKNIILINHWIKDHGILYYIFLKPFFIFTKNIELVRFSNIFLYLITSIYLIYSIQKAFKSKLLTTIVLFFYSLNHYFVYLSSWISPFNLVVFFSFISILSLIKIIFSQKTENLKSCFFDYFIFTTSTISAFYSDYSFIILGFFYIFIYIFLIFFSKKDHLNKLLLIITTQIILIIIVPGLFQLINNLTNVKNLNNYYFNISFFDYLNKLFQSFISRTNNFYSLFLMIFLVFLSFFYKIKFKKDKIVNLNLIFVFNLLFLIFFQYLFNKNFFSIFSERSFWYFYINLVFIFAINSYIFLKNQSFFLRILGFLFFLIPIFGYINHIDIDGNIKHQIDYKSIKELFNKKNQLIILINKDYDYYPITNYFLNPLFNNNFKNHLLLKEENEKNLFKKIDEYIKKNENNEIVIVFLNYYYDKYYRYQNFLNKNIKIYHLYSYE